MKLRVRYLKARPVTIVEVSEEDRLQCVKLQLLERRVMGDCCFLSLNGKEPLDERETLADLNIVSGDLLHIMCDSECCVGSNSCMQPHCSSAGTSPGPSHESVCRNKEYKRSMKSRTRVLDAQEEKEEKEEDKKHLLPSLLGGGDRGGINITNNRIGSHFEEFVQSQSVVAGSMESPVLSAASMVAMGLHMMMLDAGFMHNEESLHSSADCTRRCYSTAIDGTVLVYLACLKMGPWLTVHASASLTNEGTPQKSLSCSHKFSIDQYTAPTQTATRQLQDTSTRTQLRNTAEVSRVFKDSIAHKLLTEIRIALDLPEEGTLSSLFPELKFLVLRMLDILSFTVVSAVSREFHVLCQQPHIWRYLCLRDFGRAVHLQETDTWKQLYVRHYSAWRARQREKQRHFDMMRWPQLHIPYPFHPTAQPFTGLVGGNYDRRPFPLAFLPPRPLLDPRLDLMPLRPLHPGHWHQVDQTGNRQSRRFRGLGFQ